MSWLREHRGSLTVRDGFSVLADPWERETCTHRLEHGVTASMLVVRGMYCAA